MASSCCRAVGKLLSLPLGEYGRKAELCLFPFFYSGNLHTENLKELAGEHHKGWMLRFNWTQRRETHQERQQYEAQTKDLCRQAERYCMASVSSCREVSG